MQQPPQRAPQDGVFSPTQDPTFPHPHLYIFNDPALDGPTNMARDEHLLYADDLAPAALRLYAWSPPTISLGYFQSFSRVAELEPELRNLAVVRRQTGGGAILHDREITYCLVLHDGLPLAREAPARLYQLAHQCWRAALLSAGITTELAPDHFPLPTPRTGSFFCFEKPGRTDLLLHDRKLLGSAQRRVNGRVLQHGSLLLEQRFAAHPGVSLGQSAPELLHAIRDRFVREIATVLALNPAPANWSADRLADVETRRQRFASPQWTQKQP